VLDLCVVDGTYDDSSLWLFLGMIGANLGRFGEPGADSYGDRRGSSNGRFDGWPALTAAQPGACPSSGIPGCREGPATGGGGTPPDDGTDSASLHPGSALGGGRGSPSLKLLAEAGCIVADDSIEGRRSSVVGCGILESTGDMFTAARIGGSG
jgi:hypothetical protein